MLAQSGGTYNTSNRIVISIQIMVLCILNLSDFLKRHLPSPDIARPFKENILNSFFFIILP